MPIISKVSAQKKARYYNIFLDEQYAFSVSQQTLAEFILVQGQELTPEKIDKIKQFDASARATDLAVHYLNYSPRSVYEILQYLAKHKISDEAANKAVSELTELGYLDDHNYARLFISNNLRVGSSGPASVSQKLALKGVAEEIVQEEIAKVESNDWIEVGKRLLKSFKNKRNRYSFQELKQKMYAKLLKHGFTGEISKLIIDEFDLPKQDEEFTALKAQGIKAYKRFRRLEPSKRKQKMRNYLFTHGFSSSEISTFLDGDVIPLSELDEY